MTKHVTGVPLADVNLSLVILPVILPTSVSAVQSTFDSTSILRSVICPSVPAKLYSAEYNCRNFSRMFS